MDWNKIYVCWEKNGTLGRVSGGRDTSAALQRIGRLFQGRPGKGTPRIGVGVTPSAQKHKAVLILLIIKLERRNRLTCFLIMYYFCPFTVEAQTAVFMLAGLSHHGLTEDDSWNVPGWKVYPKLSSW